MNFQENISLAPYSCFRIGGEARFFISLEERSALEKAVLLAEKKNIPILPLGGGSNILFSDKGFKGMVLFFSQKLRSFLSEKTTEGSHFFEVSVGTPMSLFFRFARNHGADFSALSTIPGTVGGAVFGNAGIPQYEIGDFVESVEVFDLLQKRFYVLQKSELSFGYRSSFFQQHPEFLLWKITLALPRKKKEDIAQQAEKFLYMRKEKQPWGKTGGSFFANPPEGAAGYFLDQVGMKGISVGDAFFSEKHANFLMNAGKATQEDIITLGRKGKKAVQEKFGVELRNEVRILDEKGELIRI